MQRAIENRSFGTAGPAELFATVQMSSAVRGAVFELVVGRRHHLVAIAEVDCAFDGAGALRLVTDARELVGCNAPYLPAAELAIAVDAPWSGPLRMRAGRGSTALVDKIALRGAFEWPVAAPANVRAIHQTGPMPRVELHADPDFSRFHTVAPDQRMPWLTGTEWFEVDGPFGNFRGALPRIELRCRVELSAFVGDPEPLEPIMALDRLVIRPQRGTVTIGGRCHVELSDRATLDAAHFSFGLGVAGSVHWAHDLTDSATQARPSLAKPPTTIPPRRFGTMLLEPEGPTRAPTMLLEEELPRRAGTMLLEPLRVDATADTIPAASSGARTLPFTR